jgi:hypothetical protein
VLPVHTDQPPDQRALRIEAELGQGSVEHVAAPPGLKQFPGVRLEIADVVVGAQPPADRGEAAAHEVALQVERVVQVEHHDPGHRPPGAAQKMAWS